MRIEKFLNANPVFVAAAAVGGMERAINERLAEVGLGFFQALALATLYFEEDRQVTVVRMANVLRTSKARMSQVISVLEQKKLLRRQENPADRRYCLVLLTKSGRDTCMRVVAILDEWQQRAEAQLGEDKVTRLIGELNLLATMAATEPQAAPDLV